MKALIILGMTFFFVACNSYHAKNQNNDPLLAQMSNPDFATIQKEVLQPYCLLCHNTASGSAINVETYANVIKSLSQIQLAINTPTMPPGTSVSGSVQIAFNRWVANGAPEFTNLSTSSVAPQNISPEEQEKIAKWMNNP